MPSFHSTASTGISQVIAARFFSSSTTFSAACVAAMPVAKVTREPPVRKVKPIEAVSATIVRTRSAGTPSTSATIMPIEAREPPMSGLPVAAVTEPSSLTWTVAVDSPPMLNQKPDARPRPWPGFSGDFQCGWVFTASSTGVEADVLVGRAVMGLGAVLRRVLLAQRQRIDAQLQRQFVDGAFDRERGDRRARGAIGRDLRTVADRRRSRRHRRSGCRTCAKPHMQPGPIGEPAKAPAWNFSTCLAATMVPSFLAPSLTSTAAPEVGPEPRKTSSRVICIFTDRPDLLRQRHRHRLQVDQRLAAEAAADFGRVHPDVGHVDAEQLRRVGADHEVTLAGGMDRDLAVGDCRSPGRHAARYRPGAPAGSCSGPRR